VSWRYLVIIEKAARNYSAYSPDVPGCVATGRTRQEAEDRMREAIELHLRGMKEDGLPIPKPVSTAEFVTAG
jgi:predicted RNase H-like HicB family nuclease